MSTSEETSDFPTAWRPNPGDSITGKMVEVSLIDPNGQGQYPCLTLEEDDGERVAIHAFHSVLQREIARRRPKLGDELSITYQGKKPGGKNGEYHAYRVTGGQGNEVNWDSFLPAEERQAQSSDPLIAPSPAFAGVSATPASSVPAGAEDMGPLPPSNEPSVQEKAAERFGDKPPWEDEEPRF